MGKDEPGHKSGSRHIPIELSAQKELEVEVSMTGFQMVKLGNFKDTTKMVFPDLWMEDSWMHTRC